MSVEILAMSPPTSAAVGVFEAGAGFADRDRRDRRRGPWNVMRIVSAGEPGAAVVNSAPHVPASGRSTSRTYMPRSSSIVQMNAPSAVATALAGSWSRS